MYLFLIWGQMSRNRNMLKKNKSIEEICDIIGCDAEYVQKIMQA